MRTPPPKVSKQPYVLWYKLSENTQKRYRKMKKKRNDLRETKKLIKKYVFKIVSGQKREQQQRPGARYIEIHWFKWMTKKWSRTEDSRGWRLMPRKPWYYHWNQQ
jgi:hypothetical protein